MVGTEVVKVRKQKGDAWWTDEVKEAVEQKKAGYVKTLQRNVLEHVMDRIREYMECKRRVKWVIKQSKMKVDEKFGRKLSEMYRVKNCIGRKYRRKEMNRTISGGK